MVCFVHVCHNYFFLRKGVYITNSVLGTLILSRMYDMYMAKINACIPRVSHIYAYFADDVLFVCMRVGCCNYAGKV